jgi:hypothetical protein
LIMQHAISTGNTRKRPSPARRGVGLVRLDRRDMGLGAAGLGLVRALVVDGGDALAERRARGGAGGGEGGGLRCAGGDGTTMGWGGRILA